MAKHRAPEPHLHRYAHEDDSCAAALERVADLARRWRSGPPALRVAAAELEDAILPPPVSTGNTGDQPAVLA